MSAPWLLSTMGLHLDEATESRIWACVPPAEIEGPRKGAVSIRGMIALMEGVKRYGPMACALIAADAIPRMIEADALYQRREATMRAEKENPDCLETRLAAREAELAQVEATLAYLELLDPEDDEAATSNSTTP